MGEHLDMSKLRFGQLAFVGPCVGACFWLSVAETAGITFHYLNDGDDIIYHTASVEFFTMLLQVGNPNSPFPLFKWENFCLAS